MVPAPDFQVFLVPALVFTVVQIPLSVLGQSNLESVVAGEYNISAPSGSQVVLQCHSPRMVWTQDRLKDRLRVVHWDLQHSSPDFSMERMVDMFSGGEQRIYSRHNSQRIHISQSAFSDGNFSLTITNVSSNDRGIYSCNLHHHYCHRFESIKMQLNTTKSTRKQKRFWDGQKMVFVVMAGSTVLLPCVNRRQVWLEGHSEEDQQVVHWDRQSTNIQHHHSDRLIDLYASGERRHYGPHFLRSKMNISSEAFTMGDFSLIISKLQPQDQGIYYCHLHHHYCSLNERRIYHLSVSHSALPPLRPTTSAVLPDAPQSVDIPGPQDPHQDQMQEPPVINVIVPESQSHFLQQLAYILAALLILGLGAVVINLLLRRSRSKGAEYDIQGSQRDHAAAAEMEVTGEKACNQGEPRLEYKNNILKEKAEISKCSPAAIASGKDVQERLWK